jgi:raffinose/stachyose/melibiose transport system permease protein
MKLFNKSKYNLVDRMHPLYYAVPAMFFYFIFFLFPIFLNLGFSLTDWTVFTTKIGFAGFKNFIELFKNSEVLNILKNTFEFTIAVALLQNLFGFFLALALHKRTILNSIFRGIIFFPCLISMVVWGQLYSSILAPNGILNKILSAIFFSNISFGWLGSRYFTIFVVAFVNVWVWTGFSMMIYITSINTISSEIIDAGDIDGLSWFGRIRHITIPLIMPGITINIIISLIGSMKVFDIVMVLTKGGPGRATEVFNTFIYRQIGLGYYGYSAALNLILIIIVAAIAFPLYNFLSKRIVEL